jgi:hypothetical protein
LVLSFVFRPSSIIATKMWRASDTKPFVTNEYSPEPERTKNVVIDVAGRTDLTALLAS